SWARMRPEPETAGTNSHLGRGCGLSPRPPEQTRILGADAADPGVVSCARSVTHRRMRSLACSSPPAARHAPHPDLLRPTGRSGLLEHRPVHRGQLVVGKGLARFLEVEVADQPGHSRLLKVELAVLLIGAAVDLARCLRARIFLGGQDQVIVLQESLETGVAI